MKIKRGDNVKIIAGKYKNLEGIVKKTNSVNHSVVIEGVNIRKRHQKANANTNEQGKIIEKEAPIDVSNVVLIHPKNKKKTTKISYAFDKNNKKYRVTRDKKTKI